MILESIVWSYSQKYGVDFENTFAPVVEYSTIRLLFALANELDMDIDHFEYYNSLFEQSIDRTDLYWNSLPFLRLETQVKFVY